MFLKWVFNRLGTEIAKTLITINQSVLYAEQQSDKMETLRLSKTDLEKKPPITKGHKLT